MTVLSSSLSVIDQVYRRKNYVVLDTETTGLAYGSEIVEIAVVGSDGNVLINTRVKPIKGIPEEAANVHGIRGRDVSGSPLWADVRDDVRIALFDKDVIIYNAPYDIKMLRSSDGVIGLKDSWDGRYYCLMLAYAEYRGEWNASRLSYRWHKLTAAMYQQGLPMNDAHSALGDCQMALRLLRKMSDVLADKNN